MILPCCRYQLDYHGQERSIYLFLNKLIKETNWIDFGSRSFIMDFYIYSVNENTIAYVKCDFIMHEGKDYSYSKIGRSFRRCFRSIEKLHLSDKDIFCSYIYSGFEIWIHIHNCNMLDCKWSQSKHIEFRLTRPFRSLSF